MQRGRVSFIVLICFTIRLTAQEFTLEQVINFRSDQITIPEALKAIEQETGLLLAYPSNILPTTEEKIKVDWKNKPLGEAVKTLFPDLPMQVKIIGKNLVIKPLKNNVRRHLKGNVKDKKSGEDLIGASVMVKNHINSGVATNQYGFFSLALEAGRYDIVVSYLGYQTQTLAIDMSQSQRLDIRLDPTDNSLEEVVVIASSMPLNSTVLDKTRHQINLSDILRLSFIGGEPDVIKMVQNIPGIKTVGEGSSGLYVRGGNIDQNLILLDEAPVYNPSHFLGFFSIFHPDAIRHAELYKGNFPIEYGGRLSSVLNLKMKEGNKQQLNVEGGIGLLSSRVLVEGPITRDKHSFMVAARRSYPDIFLDLFSSDEGGNKARFLDLNAKLNFTLNPNDRLFISLYDGRDIFRFFDAYENRWGNTTATLRWNHILGDRHFVNFTGAYSKYQYTIDNFIQGIETFNWTSGVQDITLKADFSFHLDSGSKLKFGAQHIFHRFEPGKETNNKIPPVPIRRTIEQTVYLGHQLHSGKWHMNYGLRLNAAHNHGKTLFYNFDDQYELVDTVNTSGGIYHSKFNLSPRLSVEYQPREHQSMRLSLSQTVQYLHELRNSITGFNAFYSYLPSGTNIPEQRATQLSLEFYRKFPHSNLELGADLYYKWLANQIDFIPHSRLLQNHLIEQDLRIGSGRAYGVEFFINKKSKKWNGTLAYSFSRTFRTIPTLNEGRTYPTYYDQPHAINCQFQFQPRERWQFTLNWQYHTGGATTLPVGSYQFEQTVIPIYSTRNGARLPDYHRLDLSFALHRKKRAGLQNHSSWTFGVYNAYFRKNALSIDLLPVKEKGTDNIPDPTDVKLFKTYIFGAVPTVSYHFKFL